MSELFGELSKLVQAGGKPAGLGEELGKLFGRPAKATNNAPYIEGQSGPTGEELGIDVNLEAGSAGMVAKAEAGDEEAWDFLVRAARNGLFINDQRDVYPHYKEGLSYEEAPKKLDEALQSLAFASTTRGGKVDKQASRVQYDVLSKKYTLGAIPTLSELDRLGITKPEDREELFPLDTVTFGVMGAAGAMLAGAAAPAVVTAGIASAVATDILAEVFDINPLAGAVAALASGMAEVKAVEGVSRLIKFVGNTYKSKETREVIFRFGDMVKNEPIKAGKMLEDAVLSVEPTKAQKILKGLAQNHDIVAIYPELFDNIDDAVKTAQGLIPGITQDRLIEAALNKFNRQLMVVPGKRGELRTLHTTAEGVITVTPEGAAIPAFRGAPVEALGTQAVQRTKTPEELQSVLASLDLKSYSRIGSEELAQMRTGQIPVPSKWVARARWGTKEEQAETVRTMSQEFGITEQEAGKLLTRDVSTKTLDGIDLYNNPVLNPVLWAKYPQAITGGIGGGLGAIEDEENRLRGFALGAVGGIALGLGGRRLIRTGRELRAADKMLDFMAGRGDAELEELLGKTAAHIVSRPKLTKAQAEVLEKGGLKAKALVEIDIAAKTMGLTPRELSGYVKTITGKSMRASMSGEETVMVARGLQRRLAELEQHGAYMRDFEYTSTGHIRRLGYTSITTGLRRLGAFGIEASDMLDQVSRMSAEKSGINFQRLLDTKRALKGLARHHAVSEKKMVEHFRQVMLGNDVPMGKEVAVLAEQERGVLDKYIQEAIDRGFQAPTPGQARKQARLVKKIENYLPQVVDIEKLQQVAQDLRKAERSGKDVLGTNVEGMLHKIKGGSTEVVLRHLIKTGQAKNQTDAYIKLEKFIEEAKVKRGKYVEHARTLDLPDDVLDTDPIRGLAKYYWDTDARFADMDVLGKEYEKIGAVIDKMPSTDAREYGRRTLAAFQGINPVDDEINRVLATVRSAEVLFHLGLAQMLQYGQRVNIPLRTGHWEDFVKAINPTTGMSEANRRMALEAGATVANRMGELFTQTRGKVPAAATYFLRFTGMTPFDRGTRQVAYEIGRYHADRTFTDFRALMQEGDTSLKSSLRYAKELRSLDIDPYEALKAGGLTEAQVSRAGFIISDETQFANRAQDFPVWYNEAKVLSRILLQFKTFAFQQSKLVRQRVLEDRDPTAVAMLVTLFPATGWVIGDMRGFLSGKNVERNQMEVLELYADAMSYSGTLGLAFDAFRSLGYGKQGALGFLAGPAISDTVGLLAGLWADGKRSVKEEEFSLESTGKFALGRVPVFGAVNVQKGFEGRAPTLLKALGPALGEEQLSQ